MMKKFFSLSLLLGLGLVGFACADEAVVAVAAPVVTAEAPKVEATVVAAPVVVPAPVAATVEAPKAVVATPAAKVEAKAPEATPVAKAAAKVEPKKVGRCRKALNGVVALPGATWALVYGHPYISCPALALAGVAVAYNYSESFRNWVTGSDDEATN